MENIDTVNGAIQAWATLIQGNDKSEIINYLNQGFCFQVSKIESKKWEQQAPTDIENYEIHAYPAIFGDQLKFVLIDSVSDLTDQTNTDNILVKDFTRGVSSNPDRTISDNSEDTDFMTEREGLSRNFRWNMYCKDWLSTIIATDGRVIFQAICIPYSDYQGIFENEQNESCINFLGLRGSGTEFEIEIIIANEPGSFKLPEAWFDISRPVPPFGGGGVNEATEQSSFKLLPSNL